MKYQKVEYTRFADGTSKRQTAASVPYESLDAAKSHLGILLVGEWERLDEMTWHCKFANGDETTIKVEPIV